jgi:hypothetical protein
MTYYTSTPQIDEPILPVADRDDNPYADRLTEWDIDADGILAAACEMSWEVWEGVPMRVCLTHETH